MTDLDPIRTRAEAFRDAYARVLRAAEPGSDCAADLQPARRELFAAAVDAAADVDALVAEVEGLRATLNLRDGQLTAARRHADGRGAALLEEQTAHAKTADNFAAQAESWIEARTRLLDRYARLELQAEHLRTALGEARAQLNHFGITDFGGRP